MYLNNVTLIGFFWAAIQTPSNQDLGNPYYSILKLDCAERLDEPAAEQEQIEDPEEAP